MTLAEHRAQLEETIAASVSLNRKPVQVRRQLEAYIGFFNLPLVVLEADGVFTIGDALDPEPKLWRSE